MQLIPVLDVQDGVVVHAIAGQRASYRPLRSVLTARTDPVGVAECLYRTLGCQEYYVADLDRIEQHGQGAGHGVSPGVATLIDWAAAAGVWLMIDAGVAEAAAAAALTALGPVRVVVGTETLEHVAEVSAIVAEVGRNNTVVSLDLRNGAVVSRSRDLAAAMAEDVAGLLAAQGIGAMIVLDLARVGGGAGPGPRVGAIAHLCSGVAVFAGGGVRAATDLEELDAEGAAGALVATALHSGAISVEEWRRLSGATTGEQER